jgi:hypothetical protein
VVGLGDTDSGGRDRWGHAGIDWLTSRRQTDTQQATPGKHAAGDAAGKHAAATPQEACSI